MADGQRTTEVSPSSHFRMPSRVLLIAYRFPPQGGGGVQRPAKLVKAWHRMGMKVAVVRGPSGLMSMEDPTLLGDVPHHTFQVEAPDPSPWLPLRRWRRKLPSRGVARLADRALVAASVVVRFFSLPDVVCGWLLTACPRGVRMTRDLDADFIVTTGPPFTSFLVGAYVAARTGKPLVLDYRDPWTATYLPRATPWLARRVNPWLERKVLRRARVVVAAHRAILRYLEPLMPDPPPRRLWVPNGYDPDDVPPRPVEETPHFTLTHTGTFVAGRRSPRPLLRALEDLLAEGSIDASEFRFRVAGQSEKMGLIRDLCPPSGRARGVLELEGYLPHGESVRRLQTSTVNLVHCDFGAVGHYTPGKFYEVLFVGRPVLLLSPEGPTTHLARRTGGCWIARPDDVGAIKRALLDLYDRWKKGRPLPGPDRSRLRFYDRAHQAIRLARLLAQLEGPHTGVSRSDRTEAGA